MPAGLGMTKSARPTRAGPAQVPRPLPAVSFPADLPISARIDEIVELIRAHPVVIIAGETGSGKTTQLPKACIRAGLGARGMIGHTQPRRLAARAAATRLAKEMNVPLGGAVGFAVRFEEAISAATLIKVMTDGLLLAETHRDRRLDAYEALIIDEAHERSLNVDFLLGYVKRLLRWRRDLKLIVTSATIDVEAFQAHFNGAPAVSVSGRGHPVDVIHEGEAADQFEAFDRCLAEINRRPAGAARDTLAFLPGEREILDAAHWLRRTWGERFEVLPLYARLPAKEQRRIFAPGARRRVVLATNVAETSITVPNVGYVIDFGLARIARYSHRSKIQRLPVERISQASAEQRAGRCGRVAPGTCFRLYSEADFESRPRYTAPEIKRSNLAAVALRMLDLRLGDIEGFPFIDPPDPRVARDALRSLGELGAVRGAPNGADADVARREVADQAPPDRAERTAPRRGRRAGTQGVVRLTRIGQTMARLPVDPRLARILIGAARTGCLREALIVVAALSVQDPRERPPEQREAADAAHRQDAHKDSDFASLVQLWDALETHRANSTRAAFRAELTRRFLAPARVAEWRAVHRQLLLQAKALGWQVNRRPADYESLHRALLIGSLAFIGRHDEGGVYVGARGMKFRIFPGSPVARRAPQWLMAAEIVQTRQTYARSVAKVEAHWVEAAAGPLLKRAWDDPHWDAKRGEVMAFERATVYGLPVVERRPVRYAEVDPAAARERFAHEALAPATLGVAVGVEAPFLARNAAVAGRIAELEAQHRRQDLMVGQGAVAAFYLERLPSEVCGGKTLRDWLAGAAPATVERLAMTEADLLARLDVGASALDYPAILYVDGLALPVKYRFAPGTPDDGVSVQIGLGALPQLSQAPLDWLVPGLFERKCAALIKSLSKRLRRRLPPGSAADLAHTLSDADRYRKGALLAAMAAHLSEAFGVDVGAKDWRPSAVEPFLHINVQVLDARRRLIDQDRDVAALRSRLHARVEREAAAPAREGYEQRGLLAFPEGGVPPKLNVGTGSEQTIAYPALRDAGDAVDLVLLTGRADQARTNRRGYSRLALLAERKLARQLRRRVADEPAMNLRYAALGAATALADELTLAVSWACFFEGRPLPTDQDGFAGRVVECRHGLATLFGDALAGVQAVLAGHAEAARRIAALTSPAFAASRADMEAHLGRLAPAEFLNRTPIQRLPDIARYLDALSHRAANLQGRVRRDLDHLGEAARWQTRLDALAAVAPEAATQVAVLVEEYRVSLFCQRLSVGKASAQRLERLLTPLEKEAGLR